MVSRSIVVCYLISADSGCVLLGWVALNLRVWIEFAEVASALIARPRVIVRTGPRQWLQ